MVKNNFLVEALVYHERFKPFNHRFFYKVFYLKFPIDQMSTLKGPLFSLNRFNLFSLHSTDYLDGSDRPLKEKIVEIMEKEGVGTDGKIILQTAPRMFGYGFNPVSFWYVYDAQDELMSVMAEVNNTFGDRHYYLMQGFGNYKKISMDKEFHVSPFFGIEGKYEFSFHPKSVVINYFDPEKGDYFFKSTFSQTKIFEYSTRNLLRMLIRFPFMTFMVTARIHWQALKLFIKKATFFPRPIPPKNIMSKETQR